MPEGSLALPRLYSFRRCPYAIRARLALARTEIAVEIREILLRDKPATMLALSPKGTVPVLQLVDGQVIDESLEVMHWALQQTDPDHWLDADPELTRDLIETNDGVFKQALDRYKYFTRHPEQPQVEYREQGEVFLHQLEQRLVANGGGLTANQSRLADMAIFPFVRQFAGVEPQWFANAPYPLLRRWLQRHLDSPLFARVMVKYPLWQPDNDGLRENWQALPHDV